MPNAFENSPVLSPEMWCEMKKFVTGEEPSFPMNTEDVIHALGEMGVNASRFGANRAVQNASIIVPKIGRDRAWSFANLRSLWEYIVAGGEGSHTFTRTGSVPDWMSMFAAQFGAMLLSADDFCREWMRYVKEHLGGAMYTDAKGAIRSAGQWYYVPEGAVMLYDRFPRDAKGQLLPSRVRLVPASEVATFFKHDAATKPVTAKNATPKKGKK